MPSPIGATPFFLASSVADVEIMQLLLDAGADPAQQTESKTSALMAAAGVNRKLAESPVTEEQSIEAVKLLLKARRRCQPHLGQWRECSLRARISRMEQTGSVAGR